MTCGDPDAVVCGIKTHLCSSLAGQDVLLVVAVGKGSICEVFVLWLLATELRVSLRQFSLFRSWWSFPRPGGQEWKLLAQGRDFICLLVFKSLFIQPHPSSECLGKVKRILWEFTVVLDRCLHTLGFRSLSLLLEVARMLLPRGSLNPGLF